MERIHCLDVSVIVNINQSLQHIAQVNGCDVLFL